MPRRLRPTHKADIKRHVDQSNDNSIGEPQFALETQATGVPLQYRPQTTDFLHEATGERISKPHRAVFQADRDVQEDDVIDITGVGSFDVVGITETIDSRSENTLTIIAELEAT